MNLICVFSASEILARGLQDVLEQKGISSVLRNNIQSANLAGFGTTGQAVEVFIDKKDLVKASLIVEKYKDLN